MDDLRLLFYHLEFLPLVIPLAIAQGFMLQVAWWMMTDPVQSKDG